MKISNNNQWKTTTVDASQTTTSTQDTGSSNADLLSKIDQAEQALDEAKEKYGDYMTEEQMAELERLKATLMAEEAAIEGGGYSSVDGSSSSTSADCASRDSLADLGSGWDGGIMTSNADDAASLGADDGEYMGTIEIESSGDPMDPTKLGFSIDDAFEAETMGEGGSIDQVYVRSEGRDLVVTVVGKDAEGNEIRKSWVIKEGTVRPEPIIFNFTQMSHAISFDASGAYRISDGSYNSYYGTVRGFYIHGTQYNDTIYGSQGDDGIVAWEGDDYVDGMGGKDRIWGDEWYEASGSFSENGGNDTIRGGAGSDTIYGGGGIDTRFRSDDPSANTSEATYEFERIADDKIDAAPDPATFISGDWTAEVDNDGTIVVEQGTTVVEGGEINIDMPDGYSMAFGEIGPDGSTLIITFVGTGPDGMPRTFQMEIKGFMQPGTGYSPDNIVTLNFNGSSGNDIIDFHEVEGLTHQVINIKGGSGDDIIIGASNELLQMGIEHEDLLESSVTGGYLANYVNNVGVLYESEGSAGYTATLDPDNKEIVITEDSDPNTTPSENPLVCIAAPEGFEKAYSARDTNGDLIIVLVNPTTKETIVIRVPASTGLDVDNILVGSKTQNETSSDPDATSYDEYGFEAWPGGLVPISLDENDYNVDGEEGADLLFVPKGTNVTSDASDEVIEGSFDDEEAGLSNVENTEVDTTTSTETETETE